jgi:hypothetical protein
MSLFSLLLAAPVQAGLRKRCPIKGLGAKLRVIYQDFLRVGKAATHPHEQPNGHLQHSEI